MADSITSYKQLTGNKLTPGSVLGPFGGKSEDDDGDYNYYGAGDIS